MESEGWGTYTIETTWRIGMTIVTAITYLDFFSGSSSTGTISSGGARTRSKKSKKKKTPLSSQARPFVSNGGGWQGNQVNAEKTTPAYFAQPILDQAMFSQSLIPSGISPGAASSSGCQMADQGIFIQTPGLSSSSAVLPGPSVGNVSIPNCEAFETKNSIHNREESPCSDSEALDCVNVRRGRRNEPRRQDMWQSREGAVLRTPSPYELDDFDFVWDARSRSPSPSEQCLQSLESEFDTTVPEDFPVKHTFIHYGCSSSLADDEVDAEKCLEHSASAPAVMMQHDPFSLKNRARLKEVVEAHTKGKCTPCAYYHKKDDSCRLGEDCKFCHFCPPEAMKKYKKKKMQEIRLKLFRQSRRQKKTQ